MAMMAATHCAAGGDDYLDGGAGDDYLDGGDDHDELYGGTGADQFVFASALGTDNIDLIRDFNAGEGDRIALYQYIFNVDISTDAFFRVGTAAADADDRIIYDQPYGTLYYDADGVGGEAAIPFAKLDNNPVLAHTYFIYDCVKQVWQPVSGGLPFGKTGRLATSCDVEISSVVYTFCFLHEDPFWDF